MLRLAVFISLLAIACGAAVNAPAEGRIIGGVDTTIEKYPFMLAMIYKADIICGATIVSEYFALTAASCVKGKIPAYMYLISGSTSRSRARQVHDVLLILLYPYYVEKTGNNNLALLKVKNPFPAAWAVPLSLTRPPAGQFAYIAGWGVGVEEGTVPSQNLQDGRMTIILQLTCKKAHAPDLVITDSMLCALGDPIGESVRKTRGIMESGAVVAPCEIDYGGPLVTGTEGNWVQVGVSFPGQGCGRPEYPSVFTDISEAKIRAWIKVYLPKL